MLPKCVWQVATQGKPGEVRSLWATEPGTPDATLAAEPLASDLAIAGACVVCARLRKQRKSTYTSEWRGRLHVDRKCCLRLGSNAARGSHPRFGPSNFCTVHQSRTARYSLHTTRCGATYGAAQDLSRER